MPERRRAIHGDAADAVFADVVQGRETQNIKGKIFDQIQTGG